MISLSCLTVFLCFCIFSLNLTKFILWNLRRPKRLVFFYKQETGKRHKGGEVSQTGPIWDRIQKRGWATNVQPGFGSYFWLKKKNLFLLLSPWICPHLSHHQEKKPVLHLGWVGNSVMCSTVRNLSRLRVAVSSSSSVSGTETATSPCGSHSPEQPSCHLSISCSLSLVLPCFFFLCLK